MKRKAQGLPINIIVIATISLIAVVILIYMLGNASGGFSKAAFSCESKNGECVDESSCQYEKTEFTCPEKDNAQKEVCCINPLRG
ncbi:hypothetical protein HYX08_03950 [Candidatus Woesearchaeota archaeon]|nr:hypothetical protein [Candidatus Woesearchaeota archaeon]